MTSSPTTRPKKRSRSSSSTKSTKPARPPSRKTAPQRCSRPSKVLRKPSAKWPSTRTTTCTASATTSPACPRTSRTPTTRANTPKNTGRNLIKQKAKMRTIKQVLDSHSQEVQEAIKQKKHQYIPRVLSKNERPKCKNCKYPDKQNGRCKDPYNCTLKRFQNISNHL